MVLISKVRAIAAVGIAAALTAVTPAYAQVTLVGIGDSIGEGVQSGDANFATQPYSFINLLGWRMGVDMQLPLISTDAFATVGNMNGRSRIDLSVATRNLAVSGATINSVLYDAATATTAADIATETGLVLFPQLGSQVDIAERLQPTYVACWIGNNDALGAVLAFDHLDASQLTPAANVWVDFNTLASRLDAAGSKVVFATIPDVSHIAYLLDRNDLVRLLGSDEGLPADSRTTLTAVMMVKLGILDPSIFGDPNYVLDATELQTISAYIETLNTIIQVVAAAHNMPVVDIHGLFAEFAANPPTFGPLTLTTRYLGGLFSLDGVHPSNFAHALIAYLFINAFNTSYGAQIPQLDGPTLGGFLLTDPFIDRNGNGQVAGRPGAGLVETLGLIFGISGDPNDVLPSTATVPASAGLVTTTSGS